MSADPSSTKTLREEYAQRLRGLIASVNSQAREDIERRDVLNLRGPTGNARPSAGKPRPAQDMSTYERGTVVGAFADWLRTQLERLGAQLFTPRRNPWILAAYIRGARNVDSALRGQGVDVPASVDIHVAIEMGDHPERIEALTERTQREWEGVIGAIVQEVVRELDDALADNASPREVSRRVSNRLQKVGKKRATDLAHAEVVRAAADGNLGRAQQIGVEEVAGKAEYIAVDDARTCPICKGLDENVYTIAEARGLIPQHPRCRCHFRPIVENPYQLTFATAL